MEQFEIQWHNGYPLIHSGSDVILVATGSPTTIHITRQFQFMGQMHQVVTQYNNTDIPILQRWIHPKMTTMLGMDIMSKCSVFFDLAGGMIRFDDMKPCHLFSRPFGIRTDRGVPVLQAIVNGHKIEAYLESAAKVSYLRKTLIGDREPSGVQSDFFPGYGNFDTKTWKLPTSVEAYDCEVEYGVLHHPLSTLLEGAGPKGILGIDFLRQFKVCLDVRNRQMTIDL